MTTDTGDDLWSHSLTLAQALGPLGVDVVLASPSAPRPDQLEAAAAIPSLTVCLGDFPPGEDRAEKDRAEPDVQASGAWLLALEREHQPGLVHLNGFAHGGLAFPVPTLLAVQRDPLSWFTAVHRRPAPADWEGYRTRLRASLESVELVVAPTRAVLGDLARHYGPVHAGHVIAHGIDLDRFAPAARQPVILASGSLGDPARNLDLLDRIAGDLPWPVRIAGAGSPASDNAVVVGPPSQAMLASELAAASIYALPARYEPLGLDVLAAAASGTALVLGDLPSLRETWAEDAVYVDPEDAGAWTAALRALIAEPARCAALGRRARTRALTYSADRMAASYHEIYAALGDGRFSLIA